MVLVAGFVNARTDNNLLPSGEQLNGVRESEPLGVFGRELPFPGR